MTTRSVKNTENLTIGPTQVLVGKYGDMLANARDVGMTTDDGVEITDSRDYREVDDADQYIGVIDVIKTGERKEVSFTMKEDILENLALAWDLPDNAVDEGTNTVTFGGSFNTNYRSLFVNGPAPGGGTANWEFWKVVAYSTGGTTYNKNNEAQKEVTMLCLEDITKTAGQRIGRRVDTYDDTVAPSVSSISPTNEDTDITVDTTIEWTFDEPIMEVDITPGNFNVTDDTGAEVAGSLSYDKGTNKVRFTPTSNLANSSTYLTFASGEVRDLAGNAMGDNYRTSFTTIA